MTAKISNQKSLTEIHAPKQPEQKKEPQKQPKVITPTQPPYTPKTPRIPEEIQILIDSFKAQEETYRGLIEIIWATRQKLLSYYGAPIEDGTQQSIDDNEKIRTLRLMFPPELEDMLYFSDKGAYVEIRMRQFLGPDIFSRVSSIVRGAGGEYVSEGRNSHFEVPRRT